MAKLLYVEASPRKARSHSIAVAKVFIAAYRAAFPDDDVETLDLWATELPPFDGETLDAKYAVLHGQEHTEAQAEAWAKVVAVAGHFTGVDKYLFSLPMWNFGIPYRLKHYIDVITQPGLTFSFSPEDGYKGLVTGKPAAVVYASGGAYGEGSGAEAYDMQKSYMGLWLGFIGFTDVRSIHVAPTLTDPDAVNAAREAASESAREIAAAF
ncbi:MAG: FMN-dependent NADH-azoreductase [Gammaproteobacteria bacterium]|nr:MAG: FMN-dependent NADH-azoreductase [Gammaproteobacteria bacterium]